MGRGSARSTSNEKLACSKTKPRSPSRLNKMPATHYAITEICVVLAAVYAAYKLFPQSHRLAAFGAVVMGAVAALGSWRFASGQFEALEAVHLNAAMQGGLVSMMFIGADIILKAPAHKYKRAALISLMLVSLLVSSYALKAVPLLSLIWLLLATMSVAIYAQSSRFKAVCAMSLMLVGLLLVRKSPYLDPAVSFHLYHLIIAAWLCFLPFCLAAIRRKTPA